MFACFVILIWSEKSIILTVIFCDVFPLKTSYFYQSRVKHLQFYLYQRKVVLSMLILYFLLGIHRLLLISILICFRRSIHKIRWTQRQLLHDSKLFLSNTQKKFKELWIIHIKSTKQWSMNVPSWSLSCNKWVNILMKIQKVLSYSPIFRSTELQET